MLCPTCGWIRNKKAWRPSQWSKETAHTEHFSQCKVCDNELEHAQTWYRPSEATTKPPQSRVSHMRPSPEGVVVEEARVLQEFASHLDAHLFADFLLQWMNLPKVLRKRLSHCGAVRSRDGDPCHYVCTVEGVRYFDPTNRVYSVVLAILAPELEAEAWNSETRGDICESLMGFHYLVKRNLAPGDVRRTQQVAEMIDYCSSFAYRLEARTRDDFFMWVRWITDAAAARKHAPGDPVRQQAAHQSLMRVCDEDARPAEWPRKKERAFLALLK